MTTPERLRRRQRIEGSLLVLIGVLMLVQTAYFNGRDASQRECLQENFAALSEALEVRAQLTEADSRSKSGVIEDVSAARTDRDLRRAFRVYNREQRRIAQQRAEVRLPPYPPGRCD